MALQNLRSSTASKRPDASSMSDGQIALNTAAASAGLFFKDSSGNLVKTGPVHVGTTAPNSTPATGGSTGNSKGEAWLDTSNNNYVLKIYDGTAFRSVEIAPGSARQLLQTNAAGTDVEFTSNVDVPGTLDVTGVATFDDNVTVGGNLTVNGTTTTIDSTTLVVEDKNIEMGAVTTPSDTTADGGGITLKGATDKTLTWVNSTDCWTFNQALNLTAGTESAPALVFDADVNSGIYHPAADELAISTAGSERLRINSSGVGIGESNPQEKLHISANNSAIGSNWSNANNLIRIEDTDSSQSNGQVTGGIVFEGNDSDAPGIQAGIIAQSGSGTGGGDIAFHTAASGTTLDGTESARMVIDSSGRVGIGTSSPTSTLTVDGSVNSSDIRFPAVNSLGQANGFLTYDVNSTDNGAAGTGSLIIRRGNGVEQARITQDGKIGVGTSNPQVGILDLTRNGTAGTISSYRQLRFGLDANPNYSGFIGYGASVSGQQSGLIIESLDNGNTSKTIINPSGGNVGINTASPSYSLDVEGGPSSAQFTSTANWNFSNVYIRRKASNIGIAKMISMMLDGDSASSTNLTSSLNIWGTFSGTPTTSSTSSALNAAMNLGAPEAILFHTNGSERVRITNSGKLGIGSSSPVQKLHVQGTSNDTIDETTGTLRLQASGGNGLLFGTRASSPYQSYIQSAFVADTSVARYPLALNPIGGNVGVNKIDPGYPMDIEGNLRVSSGVSGLGLIQLGSDSNAFDNFHLGSDSGGSFRIWNRNIGIGITMLQLDSNGNLTLPATLNGSGNRAVYSNSVGTLTNSASDVRMKKNVNTLESQVETIKQLNPVTYNWLEETGLGDQQEIGFIAQEVEPLVPQVIGINSDDTLSLDYPKLTAVLTKGLQEALAKIETLEQRLTDAGL